MGLGVCLGGPVRGGALLGLCVCVVGAVAGVVIGVHVLLLVGHGRGLALVLDGGAARRAAAAAVLGRRRERARAI